MNEQSERAKSKSFLVHGAVCSRVLRNVSGVPGVPDVCERCNVAGISGGKGDAAANANVLGFAFSSRYGSFGAFGFLEFGIPRSEF